MSYQMTAKTRCEIARGSLIGGEEISASCRNPARYRLVFDLNHHGQAPTVACPKHTAMARQNPKVFLLEILSLQPVSASLRVTQPEKQQK